MSLSSPIRDGPGQASPPCCPGSGLSCHGQGLCSLGGARWDRKETKAQHGIMCCPSGRRRRKLARSRMPWTCTSTALGSCYCCWQVRLQHPCCPPAPPRCLVLTDSPLSTAEAPGRRRELLHTEVLNAMGVRVRVVCPLLLLSSCLFSGTSLDYIWSSPALGYSKTRGQPQNCEVSEAGLQVTG